MKNHLEVQGHDQWLFEKDYSRIVLLENFWLPWSGECTPATQPESLVESAPKLVSTYLQNNDHALRPDRPVHVPLQEHPKVGYRQPQALVATFLPKKFDLHQLSANGAFRRARVH